MAGINVVVLERAAVEEDAVDNGEDCECRRRGGQARAYVHCPCISDSTINPAKYHRKAQYAVLALSRFVEMAAYIHKRPIY
jgi:hypothetical protein